MPDELPPPHAPKKGDIPNKTIVEHKMRKWKHIGTGLFLIGSSHP